MHGTIKLEQDFANRSIASTHPINKGNGGTREVPVDEKPLGGRDFAHVAGIRVKPCAICIGKNTGNAAVYIMKDTIIRGKRIIELTVGLGNTLQLVLFADGVAVGRSLGSVDNFIRKAFGHALGVAESRLTRTSGDQRNRGVHATQRRHVHSLATHSTSTSDAGRILTRSSVDDGINNDLDRVGISEKVDNVHGLLHDARSQQLLAVVAAVHHQRVGHALNDGALGLTEALSGITAGGVRKKDLATQLNVIL